VVREPGACGGRGTAAAGGSFGSSARYPDAMKPDFQCVLTHWNQGFMALCGRGAPGRVVLKMPVRSVSDFVEHGVPGRRP